MPEPDQEALDIGRAWVAARDALPPGWRLTMSQTRFGCTATAFDEDDRIRGSVSAPTEECLWILTDSLMARALDADD